MFEVQRKLVFIRSLMDQYGLSALHFRGVDWFSWITCGGNSTVILTNEIGVAEVLITLKDAWILTNKIEQQRFQEDELAPEVATQFKVTGFPWQDPAAIQKILTEIAGNDLSKVASDRPIAKEVKYLPAELLQYRLQMQPEELIRYRKVGKLAAEAMTEAMAHAKTDWSEQQLAGAGAQALWSRGLEPTLVLVSGAERGAKYRHPLAKENQLGAMAMMVFCARGFGLYANLTRFISFAPVLAETESKFQSLRKIEADIFAELVPGKKLSAIYQAAKNAYKIQGHLEEINNHHQGGPTGYLSREKIAGPELKGQGDFEVKNGMAFAWNPSIPGAKVEDTVYLNENKLEILTLDKNWPGNEINGLWRPGVWNRA